jgi:hypothetical protein
VSQGNNLLTEGFLAKRLHGGVKGEPWQTFMLLFYNGWPDLIGSIVIKSKVRCLIYA